VKLVSSDAQFGLSPLVLSAVVRITTNGRIFKVPSSIEEAFGFCDDLLAQPRCQVVEPGERHWPIFRSLCVTVDVRGARVRDAWFAALAMSGVRPGLPLTATTRDFLDLIGRLRASDLALPPLKAAAPIARSCRSRPGSVAFELADPA